MTQAKQNWVYNGDGIVCDSRGDVCTNVRSREEGKLIASAPKLHSELEFIGNALASWDGGDPARYADNENPYEALQAEVKNFCNALAFKARAAIAEATGGK